MLNFPVKCQVRQNNTIFYNFNHFQYFIRENYDFTLDSLIKKKQPSMNFYTPFTLATFSVHLINHPLLLFWQVDLFPMVFHLLAAPSIL